MSYAVVYSSKTGNTKMLADAVSTVLPAADCLYCGAPDAQAAQADLIFVGFWTDKGSCDDSVAQFMKSLTGKKVFLFGTAGFGGSDVYFNQILGRASANLPEGNTVIGQYMCQGKMPASVRESYVKMSEKDPARFNPLIENYDRALAHPNQEDVELFANAVRAVVE